MGFKVIRVPVFPAVLRAAFGRTGLAVSWIGELEYLGGGGREGGEYLGEEVLQFPGQDDDVG